MKNFNKIFIMFSFLAMTNIYAELNMKRCVLLPMKDNLGGALSFKVFNSVEKYLKSSSWCRYKSNSEVMNILSNYRRNLDNVLEDPKVLKVIAERLETGSMIKIDIVKEVSNVTIKLKVYSDNGEDLYFKEETQSKNDDFKVVSQIINNWLEIYSKQIPYDGRVIGVLGNQFTIDGGKDNSIFDNNEIVILRPVQTKRHPLLREIVEWESVTVGEAKILFSNLDQSQGKMISYKNKNKIKVGDWVLLKRVRDKSKLDSAEKVKYSSEDGNAYSFGKMGSVSIDLVLGSTSVTTENSTDVRKLSGSTYGVDFDVELWITRDYWASLGVMKTQSSIKGKEGVSSSFEAESPSSELNIIFGYKYLPMGFFNGPQVDFFGGYSKQKFSIQTVGAFGLTEIDFHGLSIGVRGSLPLKSRYRLNAELGLMLKPGFENVSKLYGEDESASSYKIKFGGSYQYAPNVFIDLNYSLNSVKASFESPVRSIKAKVSGVNIGTTYTF